MNKKKVIILILILIIVFIVGVITVIEKNNRSAIPQNQFGITQEDTFSVSDTSDDGISGYYAITDFTQEEKIPILEFIAVLKNEEVLKNEIKPDEAVFEYPPRLYIYKQDHRIVIFLHNASNIEVRELDRNGYIKSRKKYETTEDSFETLFKKVGITDM